VNDGTATSASERLVGAVVYGMDTSNVDPFTSAGPRGSKLDNSSARTQLNRGAAITSLRPRHSRIPRSGPTLEAKCRYWLSGGCRVEMIDRRAALAETSAARVRQPAWATDEFVVPAAGTWVLSRRWRSAWRQPA
jgi:hypothetical protein